MYRWVNLSAGKRRSGVAPVSRGVAVFPLAVPHDQRVTLAPAPLFAFVKCRLIVLIGRIAGGRAVEIAEKLRKPRTLRAQQTPDVGQAAESE